MQFSIEKLLGIAADSLQRLRSVVSTLDDTTYIRESQALSESTIGKHVRHMLDFYHLLFSSLTSDSSSPTVNYARRKRNQLTQSQVSGGLAAIDALLDKIQLLKHQQGLNSQTPITVIDMVPGGTEVKFTSSVGYEIWSCTQHLVHHNAIIAMLMHEAGCQQSDTVRQFAYAPSTLNK